MFSNNITLIKLNYITVFYVYKFSKINKYK